MENTLHLKAATRLTIPLSAENLQRIEHAMERQLVGEELLVINLDLIAEIAKKANIIYACMYVRSLNAMSLAHAKELVDFCTNSRGVA